MKGYNESNYASLSKKSAGSGGNKKRKIVKRKKEAYEEKLGNYQNLG